MGAGRGKSFYLEWARGWGFVGGVLLFKSLVFLAAATAAEKAGGGSAGPAAGGQPPLVPLSLGDYPTWLVVLLGTIFLAVFIWIVLRLIKLALWVMLIAVIVVGLGTVGWLLMQ